MTAKLVSYKLRIISEDASNSDKTLASINDRMGGSGSYGYVLLHSRI